MRAALILVSYVTAQASFGEVDGHVGSTVDPLKSLAKMLSVSDPTAAFQAPGAAGALAKDTRAATSPKMQAPADLKDLAKKLNPAIGYFDPLQLGSKSFWGDSNDATVGFLRHAEIKHGRVAMAAFVGYCLQANGVHFPWMLTGDTSFADIAAAGSPPEQWDALPAVSKVQILFFIQFLELWGEYSYILEKEGSAHYMRGGQPGKFPSFKDMLHPVPLDLYDPFKLNSGKSREQLDKSLLAEVNNGRLAMLGIMAFLAEQKIPGAVPALKGIVQPYAGEVMSPFANAELCGIVPPFCKR